MVGADLLAEHFASPDRIQDDILVIGAEGRTMKSMRPHAFSAPCFENARASDLGVPERLSDWVATDPTVRALNGKLRYALFLHIAQWPGLRVGQVHQHSTYSHGEINAALENMCEDDVTVNLEGAFYLTRRGMLTMAQMDRISHQSVYGSLGVFLKPDGGYRRARRRHDQAVADFVLAWERDGGEAFHGRRWVCNLPDGTQVAPDVIAACHSEICDVEWWFVEVELSAKAPSSVRRKLRSYRRFQQIYGHSINLRVVTGTEAAEAVFLTEGRGLTMLTTTLERFLRADRDDDPWLVA